MKVLNTSKVATPRDNLRLEAPVSVPGGSFCAPLYIGDTHPEVLGLQFGLVGITGIVQTPHVCYLDLGLTPEQTAWVAELEKTIRDQLPGHRTVWFTRDMQAEDVDYFYDTSLRGNKLRARVMRCDAFDTVDLEVFDESGTVGTLDAVKGNATVWALVAVQGVLHRSGRIAIDWVVKQVMVKRVPTCKIGLGADTPPEPVIAAAPPAASLAASPAASPLPPPPPLAFVSVVEAGPDAEAARGESVEDPQHGTEVGSDAEAADGESVEDPQYVTEIDQLSPTGDVMTLRPEAELVADELSEQISEERERRWAALQMFMEANGLDPDGYCLPDTDEEDEDGSADEDLAGVSSVQLAT